jgi:hypothetical protein
MVSTGAAIDRKTIEQRPCFLCAKNRPPEQVAVPMLEHYELLVNPFPILPLHFTLPSTLHEPQHIRTTFIDMMRMTALLPGLFLFYNGPRCGASAPDHLHFQAGQRGIVPVERDFGLLYRPKGGGEGVFPLCGYVVKGWVIVAKSAEESEKLFGTLYDTMPQDDESGEPMMNVLAWYEEEEGTYISLILPRCKHRPDCYWAEGVEKCLVSPGALDMGGLVIEGELLAHTVGDGDGGCRIRMIGQRDGENRDDHDSDDRQCYRLNTVTGCHFIGHISVVMY